jgi:hypothetical protein
MGIRRHLAVILAAAYLAGAFLVPGLHSAEPGAGHAEAHPGCVECVHGALQAPCPHRGPCGNPTHEHGQHPAGHSAPCPRCGGGLGAALAGAPGAEPGPVSDPPRRLRIVDSVPVSVLLSHARAARAPPLSA